LPVVVTLLNNGVHPSVEVLGGEGAAQQYLVDLINDILDNEDADGAVIMNGCGSWILPPASLGFNWTWRWKDWMRMILNK